MRFRLAVPLIAGIVLSAFGGWTPASASATSPGGPNHVHSILILPSNPNVVYLGCHYRLDKSTDGGRHWQGLLAQMFLSLTVDPTHPSTLYGVSLQGGFLKSLDAGVHWTVPHSRPAKGLVTGVTYDASTRTVLSWGAGVYRSTDGGSHWSEAMKTQSFSSVAVGSGKTLYAASDAGLFVSGDDGAHWKSVAVVGSQPVLQVAAASHVAYAVGPISLFKTTNDGRSWTTLSKAPIGIEFMGVAPSNPNEVLGEVSTKGFYESRNGGASWQSANSGIHYLDFSSSTVRVAPSTPNVAYTGAWGTKQDPRLHFYATHDGGRHWTETAALRK